MKQKISKEIEESNDEDSLENESGDENNTKQLLEPLDEESSSDEEDSADVKIQQLKLSNKVTDENKKNKKVEEKVKGKSSFRRFYFLFQNH